MTQKIIKVGNSFAVTVPKTFVYGVGFKAGDRVEVESDTQLKLMIVKPAGSPIKTKITPEFKAWLDDFTRKNKKALQELARL
jgi:antitoxin component of MazEF toxin-antitoxin module